MKKLLTALAIILCALLFGCNSKPGPTQVVTTTLPVYEFTSNLCKNTNITVSQLVSEDVSCLHDYTLQVYQMQMLEDAQIVIISGAGLDSFVQDVLADTAVCIDASRNIPLLCSNTHHEHNSSHDHSEADPHIWLSPANAKAMAKNIYNALCKMFPENTNKFTENWQQLNIDLDTLYNYGSQELANLGNRDCITFHDGFAYLADAFDLNILRAIEEESGSEASAQEIVELITLIDIHKVAAIFTERNGTASSADILHNEIGVPVYELDMAMSGNSYFDAMYHNINTLKEALK